MPSFIVLLVAWCSLTLTSADVYCFFLLLLLFSSSSCFGEVERKCGDDRILKKLLLLTPNRLSGQTKHSLSLSILLPLSHTPTHPRTPPPVLCTRISHWLHSSQIRSIFHPSKKKTTLSLLIALWRPHIATVIVVSQQSITHQCETATLMQRKHNATSLSFPPKSSVLWNLHPAA